jgi:diketogulonate reductase-like aldo/keto reductase
MPSLGFGCAFGNWTQKDKGFFGFEPEQAWSAVPAALRAGFRHLDCALVYNTHRAVGISLGNEFAAGRLKRSDVFITTKVFHPPAGLALNRLGKTLDMLDPAVNVTERILHDLEVCLDELSVGYVDLLLMHWPGAFESKDVALNRRLRLECWRAFETIYASGRARAIGVSNFLVPHLDALLAEASVAPMVNQIEVSPYLTQADLVQYCQQHQIAVVAWGPFGSGVTGVLADPVVERIAAAHNKNGGQVILRWLLQLGVGALPKSTNEARMRSNLDVFDFALTDDEVAALSALNCGRSSVTTAENIA